MNSQYNKTVYSVLGGAVVTVAAMLIKKFGGPEFTAEEQQAVTVLVMAALTFIVPNKEPTA